MQIYLIILFILFGFSLSKAQEQVALIDSLIQEINTAQSDTSLANIYLELADNYKYLDQDSTLKYVNLAKASIVETYYPKGLATATGYEAGIYFMRGEYEKVAETARIGLQEIEGVENLEKLRADLLRIIGVSYGSRGIYDLSLKFFLDSQNIYKAIGDSAAIITSLNNIGVVHLKLNDFEEALEIFEELSRIADFNNPDNVTIPVNLGFIYYELGQLQRAKDQLQQALNYPGEIDKRAYGLSYFKLGEIYSLEGKFDEAIDAFNASIAVYAGLDNELEKVQSLNGIARVYLEQNDYLAAETYANQALDISTRFNGLPQKRNSLETLYLLNKKNQQPSKALSFLERFHEVSDSLQNAEVDSEIARLSAEYEFYQKENELLIKQKEQELKNQAQINRQKLISIGLIIVVGLALILIIFMHRTNLHKKETNKLLSLKNDEIQDKAEKLEQSNVVKNRLFSILAHDLRGPLSSLYGAFHLIESNAVSQEELDRIIPDVAKRFKYTSTLLNNLLQWSQSQMEGYKVEPSRFDLISLIEEKKQLLKTKLDEKEINLTLPEGEYVVYADRNMIDLVVQNLISNSTKYCFKGGQIEVSITGQDEEGARVSIKDSGIGIKSEDIEKLFSDGFYTTEGTYSEKGTGLGLMLCKDFITRNNGEIWVESNYGKGSTFHFTIPHP
ncbi:MAG: tetratricopeptide repeat-containing sensor histidine kinase [Balneolaceae bacterium]